MASSIAVETITNMDISFSKRVTTIPILSKGIDATFPLEGGSGMNISFTFKRDSPLNPDDTSADSRLWTNVKWYRALTDLIDVWQLRTDGYIISFNNGVFENDRTVSPYVASISGERGYIKRISRNYVAGYNTLISGTIDFVIGTAYVSTDRPEVVDRYEAIGEIVLKPGALKDKSIYVNPVGDIGVTAGSYFGEFATRDRKISAPMIYTDSGVRVMSVSLIVPPAPSSWLSIARNANAEFAGWRYNGEDYMPDSEMIVTVPENAQDIDVSIELTAIWK